MNEGLELSMNAYDALRKIATSTLPKAEKERRLRKLSEDAVWLASINTYFSDQTERKPSDS